jgi:4-amino-4-deoxy-L-arabinose transferase-like glycosyltransferase
MMVGAFSVLGINEYAARLGPAVCGLLTIFAIWFSASRVERKGGPQQFGIMSALVTGSVLGLIVFSRAASFDIVITTTATWALSLFLLSEISDDVSRKHLFLAGCYVLIGLSLLAKGLIGIVIPVGVVSIYFIVRREWPSRLLLSSLLWGVPLACLVSALWYGPVIARNGWTFVDEFFIQHHFARYVSNKYHHPQPFYFYFVILALLTLPWTAYVAEALVNARLWGWSNNDPMSKTRVFAVAWLVMPVLFFSFSVSKLPAYILPAVPAAAMLVGDRVAQGNSKWGLQATGVVCLLLSMVCLGFSYWSGLVSGRCALAVALPLGGAGLFAVTRNRSEVSAVLAIVAAVMIALVIALNCAASQIANRESVRDLLLLADRSGYASVPVFVRQGSERTAEFYAAGRVVYDERGEPVVVEDVSQMPVEARRHGGKILVFVPLNQLDIVMGTGTVDLIGQNETVALVGVHTK